MNAIVLPVRHPAEPYLITHYILADPKTHRPILDPKTHRSIIVPKGHTS